MDKKNNTVAVANAYAGGVAGAVAVKTETVKTVEVTYTHPDPKIK